MKIIKDILKIIINKSLGYLGLKITKLVNTKPVKTWDVGLKKISDDGSFDFSDNNKINPRYIGYLIHGNTVLVNVNPDNGRGLPIHRYGITGNHPFVAASIIALRNPKEAQFKHIYDVLEQYYISVCPSTAGELAGVSNYSCLHKFPSWGLVMPWDLYSPVEQMERVKKFVATENYYFNRNASIENGWAWVGPADKEKCLIESKRLFNLLCSIEKEGYKRHDSYDGDIRAIILLKENDEWVWQSTGGQHRAAILTAMGYLKFPVRVHGVIKRQDVACWPNVVNGIYSQRDAILVFDNIFNGKFDYINSNWNNYLKTNLTIGC